MSARVGTHTGSDNQHTDAAPYIPGWAPFLVLLFTALLYSRTLFNGFTSYDDDAYIINNPFFRDFSWDGIKAIFSSFYAGNYHPLTMLLYLFEHSIFGTSPLPYHLLSVSLHLLNTWLAFKLATTLSGNRLTGLIVSILFAIHPMHVESVAWASELKDVLYSAFYLSALLFYLRYAYTGLTVKNYIAVLALFLLSLLSKSSAVTFPVLLIGIDVYKGRTINVKSILEKIPFFLLSLLFGILNVLSQRADNAFTDMHTFGFVNRIFLLSSTLSFYLVKLVAPVSLSAMHFFPRLHRGMLPGQYYTSLPLLLLIIIALLLMKRARLKKEIVFGLFFFLITISVMLQIVAVGFALTGERYTYIPYFGLFYIAGQWISSAGWNYRKLSVIIPFALVVIAFTILSFARIGVWKNDSTLYADIRKKHPDISMDMSYGFSIRGDDRKDKGQYKDALADYNQAILLNPRSATALCNIGYVVKMMGDEKSAMAYFNKALSLDPKFAEAYNNRGGVYFDIGDMRSAMADFNKAISVKPGMTQAYNNRGSLYYHLGDTQAAITDYNKAMLLNPQYPGSYNSLGQLYYDKGDTQAALQYYNNAILRDTTFAPAYNNRGWLYLESKDVQAALRDFDKAIHFNPNYAEAYNNRGWAYYLAGNLQVAIADYDNAISLNPRYELAYNNRGCAYYGTGNVSAAIQDYNTSISINPKDPAAYSNVAAIKANSGDLQGAIASYNSLLQLMPNDKTGYKDRGMVRYYLKDTAAACADWHKAAALGNDEAAKLVSQYCH